VADLAGNRWRSARFREAVSLQLQVYGLEQATPTPIPGPRALSESLSDDPPPLSHIEGVPGWAFGVHADVRQGERLGPQLDAAEQAARLTGREHFGVIAYRRERATSDAFAILTLSELAALILAAQLREA